MRAYTRPQQARIVYFSGTGGTKRVARFLAKAFTKRAVAVEETVLNGSSTVPWGETELLVMVYPVYALNAPKAVYDYIKGLPVADRVPAAVISVSGGGEVSPNTASRLHVINFLKRKGYETVYEEMLVMPSNIFIQVPDEVAFGLLRALPQKTDKIAAEIVEQQRVRRTKPHLWDKVLSSFAEIEKRGSKQFGKKIRIGPDCNGCGLCAESCPSGNIRLADEHPLFGDRCQVCLKCIYDCPQKALSAGFFKVAVLKSGYDLAALEKRLAAAGELPLDEAKIRVLTKGYALSGVRRYLLEREK